MMATEEGGDVFADPSNEAMMKKVQAAAWKKILFLPHAVAQMSKLDRMINTNEVINVIKNGQIIEDYPEDVRGHSCLLCGRVTSNRSIHVVCSPKEEYLAIITAYLPNAEEWNDDFTQRRVTK